ncbi:MAG: hypothetical protein AAFX95_21740 [Cyanobacteria bacterium J06639_16]
MTDSSDSNGTSRLDRIEKLVEANALAIEGLRVAQEADRLQLCSSIEDLVAMLAQQSEAAAQERAEVKQQQEESDQRFETMLAEMRADRTENRQNLEVLLAEIRADREESRVEREANRQEHKEFRQAIRALIAS